MIFSLAKNPEKTMHVAKANKDDLGRLFAEYQPRLRSFIRKRVENREDAEDILQDVFYQLVKTVNTAMNPVEQVTAWLYRVARNMIINHGIKNREVQMPVYRNDDAAEEAILQDFSDTLYGGDEALSASPETEYLRSLVWTELEIALSELPPKQREIFELTELEDIPVKDIAQTTGIPLNTLLSRKHYAVLHLRRKLAELYEDMIYS
jgi:RNA polymerase sigma factor (sigma-70 family)